jgi:hypothetical protein
MSNSKEEINLKCKWCHKIFKRKSPKINHELKQLCRSKTIRTYCTYCDITFPNIEEYKLHLISEEHIKKIITKDDAIIKKEKKLTQYDMDPYLSNNEKNVISTNKCNNIIIKYNDNHTEIITSNIDNNIPLNKKDVKSIFNVKKKEKLNLITETEIEKELKEKKEKKEYLEEISNRNNYKKNGYTSYQELIQEEIFNKPQPNKNQEDILCQLVNLNDELVEEKKKSFLEILKKLEENDADFMLTYIRDCNGLSMDSKQIYIELINKFIIKLTEIYNKGYKMINGKNIMNFISKLSK